MNTHESYVSIETAKLLKQAGFNWNTFCCYRNGSDKVERCHVDFNWNMDKEDYEKEGSDNLFHDFITSDEKGLVVDDFVSAPTLDVAHRWFREEKGLVIQIDFLRHNKWWYLILQGERVDTLDNPRVKHDTFEECLDAGVNHCARKILKNMGVITV